MHPRSRNTVPGVGRPRSATRHGLWQHCNRPSGRREPIDASPAVCHITDIESTPLAGTTKSAKTGRTQQGAALTKRTPKYVALDVHKSMTAVSVRASSGRVIARCMIPTEQAAIEELAGTLRDRFLHARMGHVPGPGLDREYPQLHLVGSGGDVAVVGDLRRRTPDAARDS